MPTIPELSFNVRKLHELLLNANLPIVSVREDKSLDWEREPTPTELLLAQSICDGLDFNTLKDTDKEQIKAEYNSILTTLEQIESVQAPTNAQVVAAIKFLAKTIRLVLRVLKRILLS